MKNLALTTRIFLACIMLGSLLLPFTVMATEKGKSLVQDHLAEANFKCLSTAESQKITTVIEEGMDTPESQDNPNVKKCARYTETLAFTEKGKSVFKTGSYLLTNCPEDMPDSGTDEFHQSFDCNPVTVLLIDPAQGGVGVLQVYLGLIYRWAAGIVGIIAILIIIVSGIQISASNGEAEAMSAAKKRIFQSLGGLALLFLASGLLYMVDPNFFKQPDAATPPPATTGLPSEPTPPTGTVNPQQKSMAGPAE